MYGMKGRWMDGQGLVTFPLMIHLHDNDRSDGTCFSLYDNYYFKIHWQANSDLDQIENVLVYMTIINQKFCYNPTVITNILNLYDNNSYF